MAEIRRISAPLPLKDILIINDDTSDRINKSMYIKQTNLSQDDEYYERDGTIRCSFDTSVDTEAISRHNSIRVDIKKKIKQYSDQYLNYYRIFSTVYIIGFIIFTFLVIGKYNGSSIEIWNRIIQPSYQLNNEVIIGKPRDIRSDEWLVSTPITLSQATGQVNYAEYNNLLGATQNLVTLNPKLPNKNIFSLLSSPNNIGYLLLGKDCCNRLSNSAIVFTFVGAGSFLPDFPSGLAALEDLVL